MSPFGKYISLSGTTLMVRVPGDRQRNYPIRHERAAMAARDAIAASLGLTLALRNERGRITKRVSKSKRSVGLPCGVSFCESSQAFGVIWREGPINARVTKRRSFSICSYGTEARAREVAIEWRKKMEIRHYDNVINEQPVDVDPVAS